MRAPKKQKPQYIAIVHIYKGDNRIETKTVYSKYAAKQLRNNAEERGYSAEIHTP